MCKCSWNHVKEEQEDDTVLDVAPKCNVAGGLVVPILDALKKDVQDAVCEHLT